MQLATPVFDTMPVAQFESHFAADNSAFALNDCEITNFIN